MCGVGSTVRCRRFLQVAVVDHGFTVGDGVFETLKTEAGVPFCADPPPAAPEPFREGARLAGRGRTRRPDSG